MEQQSNNSVNQKPKQPSPRRERLRLPFENRNEDPINWIYDNRIGLCVTISAMLLICIIFVSVKIGGTTRKSEETIYIDLSAMELIEQAELEKKQPKKQSDMDWSSVRNLASNENASSEELKDDKGTDVEALKAAAEAVERERRANQEAYEKGLRKADAIAQSNSTKKGEDKRQDVKRKGVVTVNFSFTNPVRNSVNLVKPAYRCEGGGEVVVEAVLGQNGKVISATVVSGGDECMRQIAKESALSSTFNIDLSAPAKQRGTITYVFIPQ
ncbi:MAG: energy transducer TonB [Alistipes sp.]|nr:energy transducer TonB [Alistipes sp.]